MAKTETRGDIADWLRGLGLEQYAQAFHDNAIDPEILRDLTADDLIDLGVRLVGHRRKLLAAIAALRDHPPISTAANVPAQPVQAGGADIARTGSANRASTRSTWSSKVRFPGQLGPTIRTSSLQIACSHWTRCVFDYLVGDSQQPRRNLDVERLGFLH
jgi:SAM domain (Sterile alpha motif)